MPTTATAPASLHLDEQSMPPDQLSIPALMRELTLQQRPSWLLVKLMNALEQRRQAQGMGWSRPWNKYGLTIFHTQTQPAGEDPVRESTVGPLLDALLDGAPARYRAFAASLLDDPKRLTFTFYHNNATENGRQYEGFTLSFGRYVLADGSKRDRLDIVLEDERHGGQVDGRVDRVRVYVCPWESYGPDRSFHLAETAALSPGEWPLAQALFAYGVSQYNRGKVDETIQWSHWSQRYIDYFGPRQFIPRGSSFA